MIALRADVASARIFMSQGNEVANNALECCNLGARSGELLAQVKSLGFWRTQDARHLPFHLSYLLLKDL
jgi:hypothetical protein